MYIDSHCHLDRLDLSDFDGSLDNVVNAAGQAGVQQMLCVSVTLDDFQMMADKTQPYANVDISCGVHPLNQQDAVDEQRLFELASNDRVIAVGETGLDYFYAPETKDIQRDAFIKHIRVARRLNKPLIIHTRDAQDDTLTIMREHKAHEVGGVLHCFTESWEMAEQAIAMGFYISFSGIVTFKNAAALRHVASKVPDDRFLIETDSPYLAPVPHRGKQNQPAYVVEVANMLADVRGQDLEQIAKLSSDNYRRLFGK
ncbi:YchF/TatD family DNA exonuclease [Thalassotalea ponticola]|uniref:TatD family hydrolase n=1 Tax=Thalassotalea ponticola TaxID=1523392 RepID=UPI0025B2A9EE|nr:YchF/TatD family DNA exonuclease [Thalassotalea ponticola]MDN3652730.1 YchF/TatD family DNA exonuclease [Thalassotalea ponticola]